MCGCGKDSYYDSWAFIDNNMNFGMTWSCNPCYNKEDRKKWSNGDPVEVFAAFGGLSIINGKMFDQAQWYTSSGTCEHFGLCDSLSHLGKTIVIPTIKTSVEIDSDTINNIQKSSIDQVIKHQKGKLNE